MFLSIRWPNAFSKISHVLRVVLSPILVVYAVFAITQASANASSPAISWEEICATTVCRATGHDGVFSIDFSPSAEYLVAEVKHPRTQGLFIVNLKGKARFLTAGETPKWLYDGEHIIYKHQNDIWKINVDTKKITQLTNDYEDVRAPIPSPDGKWVVFASTRSGYQDLWLVPSDASATPVKLTNKAMPSDEKRFGHSWSPNSQNVAYFSNTAEYWSDDLWAINISSKQTQKLTNNVMGKGIPSWSPDGTQIALYGTLKDEYRYTELADIYLVDVKTKTTSVINNQIKARESDSPKWSYDGRSLFFPHHSRGEVELWRIAVEGGISTRVTHQGGLLHDFAISQYSDKIALVRSFATRGREVDILSSRGGLPLPLTNFATDWQNVVEPQEISFRTVDAKYIQGFKFLPRDFDPNKKYPTVVQVHGGGTHSYYNGLNLVEQRFAQRGYVVIAVNYRGGSGFGRGFQDLSTNDWANTQALDAAAAADFVRAQKWSNGKVGIYGYSYGGITSLAAVARAPDAFDAAVPMAGIYDFTPAYENKNRLIRWFIKNGHNGLPTERPEIYDISNTIKRLNAVKTPILLMHGEADTIAPFDQFRLAKEALARHNKVFEAVSYEDEPHRFTKPENRVDMYSRLEEWMDKWLK
jgi:acylaminoacyl-peptidase